MGRDGKASDAYSRETRDIAAFFAEAESVAARKATGEGLVPLSPNWRLARVVQ